jgi:hypothetical protein
MSASTSTLLVAGAGLLGVMIGGLLAGRQQRSGQLRDRMLDVALEYVEALRGALPDAPDEPRSATASAESDLARAYKLSQKALLIFGPDSPAGEQAVEAYFETLTAFDHAQRPLDIEERILDGESTARSIWQHEQERADARAERSVDEFSVLAGRAIRSGAHHPWIERGRRLRRWIFRSGERRRIEKQLRATAADRDSNAEALKRSDAELRRALDEAEAEGMEMPVDLEQFKASD